MQFWSKHRVGTLCFDHLTNIRPVVKVTCKTIKNWSRYLGYKLIHIYRLFHINRLLHSYRLQASQGNPILHHNISNVSQMEGGFWKSQGLHQKSFCMPWGWGICENRLPVVVCPVGSYWGGGGWKHFTGMGVFLSVVGQNVTTNVILSPICLQTHTIRQDFSQEGCQPGIYFLKTLKKLKKVWSVGGEPQLDPLLLYDHTHWTYTP